MTRGELLIEYHKVKPDAKYGVITNDAAKKNGVLMVGMNPSGKEDKGYDLKECKGTFWNPKIQMIGGYIENCGYIDLFPIRNGRLRITREKEEIRYRGELLSITQKYIESLSPRLIIFANTEKYYWGFGHGWMGYEFEKQKSPLPAPKDCWKFYKITGITSTELNGNAKDTKLKGSYFLRYRQHEDAFGKAVSPDKQLMFDDIRKIVQAIDPMLDDYMSRK